MMIESLGVPVGSMATENYEINAFLSAQSFGNDRQRRIVHCDVRRPAHMNAPGDSVPIPGAMGPWNPDWNAPLPPGGANVQHTEQYFTLEAVERSLAEGGRVAAMIEHFRLSPISHKLLQRANPDPIAARLYACRDRMHIDDDHWRMSARSPLEQAIWAATGPLTPEDINPTTLHRSVLGDINNLPGNYTRGIQPARTITFTAPTRAEAYQMFMEFARDNRFGDGMALIPPTPQLVNEMLASTTRERHDVLGRMYLRGGAITVENLAINAVMSGVRPEAFPVVVAMGEALGHSWEENHQWWHIMTGNTHEMGMVISGPIVNEIGLSTGFGMAGAGNEVNNALGRTLRMLFRNIAHNIQPNLDISTHTHRALDPVAIVVAENYDATRELGWPTHSETLGFGPGSSSVSLVGIGTVGAGMIVPTGVGSRHGDWTATALTNLLPLGPAHTAAGGFGDVSLIGFPPAQARLLDDQHGSKEALIAARVPLIETVQNDPTHPDHDPEDPWRVTGNVMAVRYPMIIGEDPGSVINWSGGMLHLSGSFVNQQITGAAGVAATVAPSTVAVTAPSAPQNFQVTAPTRTPGTDTYQVTLTWDAPATDGGRPITRYQIYYLGGIDDLVFRWLDVPGEAAARTVTVTNLLPGLQYEFVIRARNDVNNTRFYTTTSGLHNLRPSRFSTRYPNRELEEHVWRMGGRGGWAVAEPTTPPGRVTVMNSNRFPQILGQDAPGIPLFYGNPNWGAAGDRYFGPNGEIWNHLGERVDRAGTRFSLLAFNNGNEDNASLAEAGLIRVWPLVGGNEVMVPMGSVITALDPDGEDAMQFITRNRQWCDTEGWLDYYINFDADKTAQWQYIYLTITAFGQTVEIRLINNRFVTQEFSLRAFNNGTCEEVPSMAGNIRVWPQLDDGSVPLPMSAVISAVDQDNNDALPLIVRNRQWCDTEGWLDYYLNFDVNKNAPWQYIYLTVTAFGQTVTVRLVNNLYPPVADVFGLNAFNNGNDNNASLANLGVIRIWTQLNGVNANIPYAGLVVTAELPNGECAMEFVRINRIWNNTGYVNLFDVTKVGANWQYIYFTATVFGQTVELLLINNHYVADVFGVNAFNNGNDNNASLANLGVIRVWTQLNGVNALVPYANLTVTAELPNGTCMMHYVRINRIWNNLDYVNMVDVTKVGANWQTMDLTLTLGSQTIVLPLSNNRF